jgi:ankyrin repeat protein
VSSKKYGLKSVDQEVFIDDSLRILLANKKISDSLGDTPLEVAIKLATFPVRSNLRDASASCAKLNNESTMFFPAYSNMEEFDYIVNWLKQHDFPNSDDVDEKDYWIGLNKTENRWYWSNGENLSDSFVKRFNLNNSESAGYCAQLSLSKAGHVNIKPTECKNNHYLPYICKYGK